MTYEPFQLTHFKAAVGDYKKDYLEGKAKSFWPFRMSRKLRLDPSKENSPKSQNLYLSSPFWPSRWTSFLCIEFYPTAARQRRKKQKAAFDKIYNALKEDFKGDEKVVAAILSAAGVSPDADNPAVTLSGLLSIHVTARAQLNLMNDALAASSGRRKRSIQKYHGGDNVNKDKTVKSGGDADEKPFQIAKSAAVFDVYDSDDDDTEKGKKAGTTFTRTLNKSHQAALGNFGQKIPYPAAYDNRSLQSQSQDAPGSSLPKTELSSQTDKSPEPNKPQESDEVPSLDPIVKRNIETTKERLKELDLAFDDDSAKGRRKVINRMTDLALSFSMENIWHDKEVSELAQGIMAKRKSDIETLASKMKVPNNANKCIDFWPQLEMAMLPVTSESACQVIVKLRDCIFEHIESKDKKGQVGQKAMINWLGRWEKRSQIQGREDVKKSLWSFIEKDWPKIKSHKKERKIHPTKWSVYKYDMLGRMGSILGLTKDDLEKLTDPNSNEMIARPPMPKANNPKVAPEAEPVQAPLSDAQEEADGAASDHESQNQQSGAPAKKESVAKSEVDESDLSPKNDDAKIKAAVDRIGKLTAAVEAMIAQNHWSEETGKNLDKEASELRKLITETPDIKGNMEIEEALDELMKKIFQGVYGAVQAHGIGLTQRDLYFTTCAKVDTWFGKISPAIDKKIDILINSTFRALRNSEYRYPRGYKAFEQKKLGEMLLNRLSGAIEDQKKLPVAADVLKKFEEHIAKAKEQGLDAEVAKGIEEAAFEVWTELGVQAQQLPKPKLAESKPSRTARAYVSLMRACQDLIGVARTFAERSSGADQINDGDHDDKANQLDDKPAVSAAAENSENQDVENAKADLNSLLDMLEKPNQNRSPEALNNLLVKLNSLKGNRALWEDFKIVRQMAPLFREVGQAKKSQRDDFLSTIQDDELKRGFMDFFNFVGIVNFIQVMNTSGRRRGRRKNPAPKAAPVKGPEVPVT